MSHMFLAAVEAATKVMGAAPTLHVWEDEGEYYFNAVWGEELAMMPAINGVYVTWWTPRGRNGRNAADAATGGNII